MPPGGPMPPNQPPPDAAKQADWWNIIEEHSASRIGRPVSTSLESVDEPISLQLKAAAVSALRKNMQENEN
jgi:hypothetical protein